MSSCSTADSASKHAGLAAIVARASCCAVVTCLFLFWGVLRLAAWALHNVHCQRSCGTAQHPALGEPLGEPARLALADPLRVICALLCVAALLAGSSASGAKLAG